MDEAYPKQVGCPPAHYTAAATFSSSKEGPVKVCVTSSRFAKWKRTAEEWFRRDSEMFERLIETVRTNMVSLSGF
jgi:hypothetical protein